MVTRDTRAARAAVNVFAWLDYRQFLDAWFDAAKQDNPRFSHRVFARLAGQKSPSLLLQVMKRERNLTASTADAFGAAMQLSADEQAFFMDLVRLDHAETTDEKNEVWARISACRRFREARTLEGEAVEYISHWYYPATRELAHRADFVPDAAWVSRALRPRVTVAQARQALDVLLSLGLLQADAMGRMRPAEPSIVTPHEVAGLAARNYHRGMLGLARDSIETASPSERHLVAVTVCVPTELVPRLKDELNAFQARLLDLCDSASGPRERVYQLHLALFPLSDVPSGETS